MEISHNRPPKQVAGLQVSGAVRESAQLSLELARPPKKVGPDFLHLVRSTLDAWLDSTASMHTILKQPSFANLHEMATSACATLCPAADIENTRLDCERPVLACGEQGIILHHSSYNTSRLGRQFS